VDRLTSWWAIYGQAALLIGSAVGLLIIFGIRNSSPESQAAYEHDVAQGASDPDVPHGFWFGLLYGLGPVCVGVYILWVTIQRGSWGWALLGTLLAIPFLLVSSIWIGRKVRSLKRR